MLRSRVTVASPGREMHFRVQAAARAATVRSWLRHEWVGRAALVALRISDPVSSVTRTSGGRGVCLGPFIRSEELPMCSQTRGANRYLSLVFVLSACDASVDPGQETDRVRQAATCNDDSGTEITLYVATDGTAYRDGGTGTCADPFRSLQDAEAFILVVGAHTQLGLGPRAKSGR